MSHPQILQIGALTESFNDRLASLYQAHRLWEQPDSEAFLREFGPQIDLVVTSGRYGCTATQMAAAPNLASFVGSGRLVMPVF